MTGIYSSITKGPISDLCKFEPPSQQSNCNAAVSQLPRAQITSRLPSFKDFALGYVAIDGDEALIGVTGTICAPVQGKPDVCFTNTDPAAIFKSGKPFATLWTQALDTSSATYSLGTVKKVNGKWYDYASS
jgi:hypothetical protein